MKLTIKSKKDAERLINHFDSVSSYDADGEKFYFVFEDRKRNGNWTLMKYHDETITKHGIGEDYCDENETILEEKDVLQFIWDNRSAINERLKTATKKEVLV